MDGQQDRPTNSEALGMTAWKHLKVSLALPADLNFYPYIQIVCCLNTKTK